MPVMSKLEHIKKLIEYMLGNNVKIREIYVREDFIGSIIVSMLFEGKYRNSEFMRGFEKDCPSYTVAGLFVNGFMEAMEFEELVSKEREKYK